MTDGQRIKAAARNGQRCVQTWLPAELLADLDKYRAGQKPTLTRAAAVRAVLTVFFGKPKP